MEFEELLRYTCLFDTNAADLDRYLVFMLDIEVAPKLIVLEDPKEYDKYKINGKFKNSSNIICSAWYSIDKFKKLFKENNIKYLVINAHRIPDVHIIIAAKSLNIKVLYLQHGMYIPFMKRVPSLFIKKFFKSLRYLYYAYNSARYLNDFSFSKKLFQIHMMGKKRDIIKNYDIFPDRAGVFSNYWKKWHKKYYLFANDSMFIMGTPDFRKYKFTEPLPNNYIAYCYQVLLEYGRITKNKMFEFYENLYKWANQNNYKIIVKVHPVADKKILKELENKFNFILEYDNIPNTEVVIGHYSSLLPFWGINNRKVICVELEGHDIHESIAEWAYVTDDIYKVNIDKIQVDSKKCRYFFENNIPVEKLREMLFDIREK